MFCRVFKQVDEKTRSQMFKLRETWHDVFPAAKLYQLDVKVSLIDPAWPIQAEPPQKNNIHLNPNFLMANNPVSINSVVPPVVPDTSSFMIADEEEMRNAVAQKERELLMLQKKKVEMEIEQAKRLLGKSSTDKVVNSDAHVTLPSAVVAVPPKSKKIMGSVSTSISQPGFLRIAPVSPSLLNNTRRRDPRLSRKPPVEPSPSQISSSLDSKSTNNKNENDSHIRNPDVNSDIHIKDERSASRQLVNKKDPRINRNKASASPTKFSKSSKRSRSPNKSVDHSRYNDKKKKSSSSPDYSRTSIRANKLPPIPKIKSKSSNQESLSSSSSSGNKVKKDKFEKINKKVKSSERKRSKSPNENKKVCKIKQLKYEPIETSPLDPPSSPPPTDITFKELKTSTKERNYIRRNREKSESPEKSEIIVRAPERSTVEDKTADSSTIIGNGVTRKDVDLRQITKNSEVGSTGNRKRSSAERKEESPLKKSKSEKFEALFGDRDVDLRKLSIVENITLSPTPIMPKEALDSKSLTLDISKDSESNWAKVKEIQSPSPILTSKSHFANVRAKLAEATKSKDSLGRPHLFNREDDNVSAINSVDTDMRQSLADIESDSVGSSIKTILSQAEENLRSGEMDKLQYNGLLRQVLQLSEAQKLKEAQEKDSLEVSKRKLNRVRKMFSKHENEDNESSKTRSPRSDDSDNGNPLNIVGAHGDIDERIVPAVLNVPEGSGKRPPLLPRPDIHFSDSDLRSHEGNWRFSNSRHSRMYGGKGWRGMRPRVEDRGYFRPMGQRGGLLPPPMMNNRRMAAPNMRMPYDSFVAFPNKGPCIGMKQMPNPVAPYICGTYSPPPLGAPEASHAIFPIDPQVIEYIDQDPMKTIQIDGTAREIRYYDKTAVILLNWDDPREISFESVRRRVFFDDESFLLNLNDDYVNVTIDGHPHKIRFGGPTRELYIDDMWFECFFGGPCVPILLDNKIKYLKLEGPPPQVRIGKVKRTDLVAGKINLIVDATTMHPVFLDAKLQKFEIGGIAHTLRFVDSLKTILIDEQPFKVEFGELPKPLYVGNRKHFVRFSLLPHDIKAGCIDIANMEGKKPTPSVVPMEFSDSGASLAFDNDLNKNAPPSFEDTMKQVDAGISGGLDMLASLFPSSMAPASQFSGYTVADSSAKENINEACNIPGLEKQETATTSNIPPILQNINVDDLFAKLVASGIVTTLPTVANPKTEFEEQPSKNHNTKKAQEKGVMKNLASTVKTVDILKSETLKVKQPGLISLLHTGMQCGGCGARFPPEHTVRYSQHLDWHFRQNRADRHSQRRPNSRRWYYDVPDWIQYQEIEDIEEREKSWFEREQQAAEAARTEEAAAVAARRETSSVPLRSGAPSEHLRCFLCHDTFHQFYNHDTDEWHLRNATEFEGNNYHPICLDDYKASMQAKEEEKPEEEKTLIELDKIVEDEDNEEKIIKEPEITNENIVDEESVVEVLSEEAEIPDVEVVEEDDDVVIKNEPVEQIIVDDADTDEETEKERRDRDEKSEIPIDFANVKIKLEPVDADDEPIIMSEGRISAQADTTHAAVLSSIDGNVQLEPTVQATPTIPAGGIRINITKTFISQPKEKETAPQSVGPEAANDEPLPPGEEPEAPKYKLKPQLEGKAFAVQPPTQRGSEISGLCSIM